MSEDTKQVNNPYTKEELLKLGIYELRSLARDIGVVSPTTQKKEALVESILAVIYGEAPKRTMGVGRGRPTRKNEKPSRLFVELIESANKPDNEFNFIDTNNYLEDDEQPYIGMVASAGIDYLKNENKINDDLTLKTGVVCFEDDNVYLRKYKFIKSDNDLVIPKHLIKDYLLKDSDLVEYVSKENIIQILSVNGESVEIKYEYKTDSSLNEKKINIEDIKISKFNLIEISSKLQRTIKYKAIADEFIKNGFCVVKLGFDNIIDDDDRDDFKVSNFNVNSLDDEYEAVNLAEGAVERTKFMASQVGSTVLIIDNITYLENALNVFPEILYGDFIEKLKRLPEETKNITVIALAKD